MKELPSAEGNLALLPDTCTWKEPAAALLEFDRDAHWH